MNCPIKYSMSIWLNQIVRIFFFITLFVHFSHQASISKERIPIFSSTSEFPSGIFFKPKLTPEGIWQKKVRAFRNNFLLRVYLIEGRENKLVFEVELQGNSDARLQATSGFMAAMIPEGLKIDQNKVNYAFFDKSNLIEGASFPQFEEILSEILGTLAPWPISDTSKIVAKLAGVGEVDANWDKTLFASKGTHRFIPATWDTIRVDGNWAIATRVQLVIPIKNNSKRIRESIAANGISLTAALKTTVSSKRMAFVVDRLGMKQLVKDGMVDMGTYYIDKYEASRCDATSTSAKKWDAGKKVQKSGTLVKK